MAGGRELSEVLRGRQAIVCVGCGGVGKTTLAAALALASAERGARTLCLTIDPARRLASSLGLKGFPKQEATVSRDWLAEHGIQLGADLTVMMLDTKVTFDDLIRRFASSEESAQQILGNRVYRHLSSHLAGTQAYMAMEKVLSVRQDERFDVVILDTPPSARALDFFDAPDRMVDVLDSPATRALVAAMSGGKRFRLNLVALSMRGVLHTLGRITGTTLLEELAGLLAAMHELFGGFGARAREVSGALRSGEFGYLLVTAPHGTAVDDARDLASEMGKRGIGVTGMAVNRVTPPVSPMPVAEALLQAQAWQQIGLHDSVVTRVIEAAREARAHRESEEQRLQPLESELADELPRVLIPAFAEDIHRPDRLLELGRAVLG